MAVDLLQTITQIPNKLPLGKRSAEPQPELSEAQKIAQGMVSIRDILAPGAMEVDFTYLHIGDTYYRTLFISGYPRQVGANWLSPIINFTSSLDISMFYYPVSTKMVMKKLRRKITEMEAELMTEQEAGKLVDPEVELNLRDAAKLQDDLVAGLEKFFQFSLYITIPAKSLDDLNKITKQVETTLGGLLLLSKPATLQMIDGFKSTLPTFEDKLQVTRNMDTTSLATTFPFTSSELTANEGVMYGLNEHNGSLVVFDRFNLENANMVIFAKSGAGKSYAVKLEAMRSLMLGTEVIVIDPENEYKKMAEVIGGSYIPFNFSSKVNINPFDLSQVYESGENELGLKILNLHSLLKVMLGDLNATQEAVIDRALVMTYKLKGITPDPDTQKNEPPLLEDLYKVFLGMEEKEGQELADRLERYVKGSASGLFDKPSNIDLNNTFTVFGIRDLEDSVRPVAMFVILDYIWTHIRRSRKRRLMVIDEAWFMLQHPDSAKFLFSLAKRARKYFLGLTTITQDVEDFIATDMGKAIVTNSSLQFLMKQSPTSVDKLAEVFYLSRGERDLLLSSNVGEGLFFAGSAHVALQVIASPQEHRLITTDPRELQVMADIDSEERERIGSLLGTKIEADDAADSPTPSSQSHLTESNMPTLGNNKDVGPMPIGPLKVGDPNAGSTQQPDSPTPSLPPEPLLVEEKAGRNVISPLSTSENSDKVVEAAPVLHPTAIPHVPLQPLSHAPVDTEVNKADQPRQKTGMIDIFSDIELPKGIEPSPTVVPSVQQAAPEMAPSELAASGTTPSAPVSERRPLSIMDGQPPQSAPVNQSQTIQVTPQPAMRPAPKRASLQFVQPANNKK